MTEGAGRLALRVTGTLALALFLLAAFTPVPNLAYARLVHGEAPQQADAIVVLGAGVGRDGVLGDHSLRRAITGILAQRRGIAPVLVMLGPAPPGGPAEAAVRGQLARDLGVPEAAIRTVAGAHTTRAEAEAVRALLLPAGGRRVALVTGVTHMRRARALFEAAGLTVVPVAADEVSASTTLPQGRLKLAMLIAQEVVARGYHRLAGYL